MTVKHLFIKQSQSSQVGPKYGRDPEKEEGTLQRQFKDIYLQIQICICHNVVAEATIPLCDKDAVEKFSSSILPIKTYIHIKVNHLKVCIFTHIYS